MPLLIAAIHGILTRQTDASWPDHFDAWLFRHDRAIRVIKKEYAAGPFPRWNCWVKNPRLARGLAAELELFLAQNDLPPTWIVAHSNGAVIALLVAKRLIERGFRVAGLILTGAACSADLERTGVLRWIEAGQLGAAISYSSPDDRVIAAGPRTRGGLCSRVAGWLWSKLIWPYGPLGRTGWLYRGEPLDRSPAPAGCRHRILVRWFRGGHSSYFAAGQIARTFASIHADVREFTLGNGRSS